MGFQFFIDPDLLLGGRGWYYADERQAMILASDTWKHPFCENGTLEPQTYQKFIFTCWFCFGLFTY